MEEHTECIMWLSQRTAGEAWHGRDCFGTAGKAGPGTDWQGSARCVANGSFPKF